MREILVLVEHRGGALRDVTFELLSLANRLAAGDEHMVSALLLGYRGEGLAQELCSFADNVLLMEHSELAEYNADTYLTAVTSVIGDRQPALTLVGHTATGMDLAPALAARSGLPLATDCTDIGLADGAVQATRQLYGGKINAQLTLKRAKGYVLTVRPGCSTSEPVAGRLATIERIDVPDWSPRRGRRFLALVEAELEDIDIAAADVLVSVGRGVGKEENLAEIRAFADAIGATLCCSRPVADKGWLPKSRQVGTSGKVVRPKVYIALGVSGAYQHLAGMRNADTIIAVNSDPAAPIFDTAHYGIVADMFQVLPVLKERFS